jgi:signal transduction histidine kinase
MSVASIPQVGEMSDLQQARQRYLRVGEPPPQVRPVVAQSWQRSKRYGVDPEHLRPQVPDPGRLAAARAEARPLLMAAEPALQALHETLADEPHILAVSDPQGTILLLVSSRIDLELAESANLFEGASWHEADIGCNGIGSCLAAGEPVILIGPEHFQQAYIGWTCIGVPLRGQDGNIVGAIDLSVPNEHVNVHTWGLTLTLAGAIQARLEGAAATAPAPDLNLQDPLNAIRGVLELLARQIECSPTHARFLDEAIRQVDRASDQLQLALQQVMQHQRRLRDADAQKDRLLATVSHELRNPINTLGLGVEVLRDEPLTEAAQDAVEMLRRQQQHMLRLVDDLLDLSRIREGRFSLHVVDLDLVDLVHRTTEDCRPMFERRRQVLHVALPDDPLRTAGDPARLRQVVSNLLVNASKFSDSGASVWLSLDRQDDQAVLAVRDEGIGIRPHMLPRIFEIFIQDPSSDKRSSGGMGIGLALVRAMVEQHGGSVDAESAGHRQGSTFTVRLPLCPPQMSSNPIPA